MNKKTEKKSAKKNSQLVLRLDKDERDAFVQLCNQMDLVQSTLRHLASMDSLNICTVTEVPSLNQACLLELL